MLISLDNAPPASMQSEPAEDAGGQRSKRPQTAP